MRGKLAAAACESGVKLPAVSPKVCPSKCAYQEHSSAFHPSYRVQVISHRSPRHYSLHTVAQGSIRALQPLQIPSEDDVMEMHSSWIAVANVSFADMLCSVDTHRDSPRNRRGGPSRTSEAASCSGESTTFTPWSLRFSCLLQSAASLGTCEQPMLY